MFAEEVGGFGVFGHAFIIARKTDGPISRCFAFIILRIHIHAFVQFCLYNRKVAVQSSIVNRLDIRVIRGMVDVFPD